MALVSEGSGKMRLLDQSRRTVMQRPAAVCQEDAGRVVPAITGTVGRDGARLRSPFELHLGADGAQFLADPAVDGGRRQRPGTGPADFGVLERDGREESAGFERPAPPRGRHRTVAHIGLEHVEERFLFGFDAGDADRHQLRRDFEDALADGFGEAEIGRGQVVAVARLAELAGLPGALVRGFDDAKIGIAVEMEFRRRSGACRGEEERDEEELAHLSHAAAFKAASTAIGSSILTRVPLPSKLSVISLPPWSSMIVLAKGRPKPAP